MLEFPEDNPRAVALLKSAIPELSRLGIPPNPINYGLWYLHFSGRRPELSAAIEKIVTGSEVFDEENARALFAQHICLKNTEESTRAVLRVQQLTTTLLEDLHRAIDSSSRLDKDIQTSQRELQAAIDVDDIEATVRNVTALLDAFRLSNREHRRSLQDADEEIGRLRNELARMQRSANIDDLTLLYNRATFYRELRRLVEQGSKDTRLCVVLCDLDHFKSINDRFGHLIGDRVLQRIGSLLLSSCREGTIAVRYGGEEFALIVPDSDLDEATAIAERLRVAIQQTQLKIRNSDVVVGRFTASFGIARFRVGDSAESLFERADKALYKAKEGGRNQTLTELSSSADDET